MDLARIGDIPIYAVDGLVRRAAPLQTAQLAMEGDVDTARMHPHTAQQYQLQDGGRVIVKQGDASLDMPLVYDARIAQDAVWVAGGRHASALLGGLFDKIDIQKA